MKKSKEFLQHLVRSNIFINLQLRRKKNSIRQNKCDSVIYKVVLNHIEMKLNSSDDIKINNIDWHYFRIVSKMQIESQNDIIRWYQDKLAIISSSYLNRHIKYNWVRTYIFPYVVFFITSIVMTRTENKKKCFNSILRICFRHSYTQTIFQYCTR